MIIYMNMVELRRYRYRLYPSKKQEMRLLNSFKICKEIHNILLSESKKLWTTNKYEFNSLVVDIKTTCPEYYYQTYSQVLQDVGDRLGNAFQNFFRTLKCHNHKRKRYPRFKSKVSSITYPQKGFKFSSNRRIRVNKIGNTPIVLHRVPKGKIKTLTIKQNNTGQWFATFVCEIDANKVKHPSKEKVGIDLGLENFATLSNGEVIKNPRFLIKSEKRLARLQRRMSKKKKGSANRKKAKLRLAKQYLKTSNQRFDFLHKSTNKLTKVYGLIAVETININNILKNNHYLTKSIYDASWSAFIRNLEYKAVTNGSKLIKVNPKNTSKTCSNCGFIVEMPLHKRKFLCSKCGLRLHRDHNSALKILNDALSTAGQAGINACGDTIRPPLSVASVNETGTTHQNSQLQ